MASISILLSEQQLASSREPTYLHTHIKTRTLDLNFGQNVVDRRCTSVWIVFLRGAPSHIIQVKLLSFDGALAVAAFAVIALTIS